MSLIQLLLFGVPTFWLGMLILLFALTFAVGGLAIVRHFIPHTRLKPHNDVAGFIFATVGVIYAVLLAFIVIVAWQNFNQAQENASREANYLADVYRDSGGLSPDFQARVKPEIKKMLLGIINEDWPAMATGKGSGQVHQISTELWTLYWNYQPKNDKEKIFLAESVSKLNSVGELRRSRILDAKTGIHPVLWFVLVSGGLLTIAFTFFFGTENYVPHLVMTALLATLIAIILFTVMLLDYPFTGDISIKPEAFRQVETVYYPAK